MNQDLQVHQVLRENKDLLVLLGLLILSVWWQAWSKLIFVPGRFQNDVCLCILDGISCDVPDSVTNGINSQSSKINEMDEKIDKIDALLRGLTDCE